MRHDSSAVDIGFKQPTYPICPHTFTPASTVALWSLVRSHSSQPLAVLTIRLFQTPPCHFGAECENVLTITLAPGRVRTHYRQGAHTSPCHSQCSLWQTTLQVYVPQSLGRPWPPDEGIEPGGVSFTTSLLDLLPSVATYHVVA